MHTVIRILPLGKVNLGIVAFLQDRLSTIFGEAFLMEPREVEAWTYEPGRGQFDGSRVLGSLPFTEGVVLGVTEEDLYAEGMNFIFGIAAPKRAVISLKRLRPQFYGSKVDEGLLRQRVLKEAVHELGHALGLGHCSERVCVMYFSNTITDTDAKSWRYCKRCAAALAGSGCGI